MKISVSTQADNAGAGAWAWGDYWAKLRLCEAFEKLGHTIVPDDCDVSIELLGGPVNRVKRYKRKVCWFYSHPDELCLSLAQRYDMMFILSKSAAKQIVNQGYKRKVVYLPACGHSTLPSNRELIYDVVYLANARITLYKGKKFGREIVNDLDPESIGINLSIYGFGWDRFPSARQYYKGKKWDNSKLNELYGRAKISLADCYEPMRREGYTPIRVFDVVLSGGFCISNAVKDMEDFFEDAVVTYQNPKDLQEKVLYYLKNEEERKQKVEKGLKLVQGHTYLARAKTIIENLK